MAAVAFVGNFVSTGAGFYIFNAFMIPLCEARGWTRAELNLAPMIGFAIGLAGQFIFGTFMHRIGPRRFMCLGPLLAAPAFIMLGRVSDLGLFYLFFTLMMFGSGAMGGIVANTAVSNWFEFKRGKAMGLAAAGLSLSGVIVPLLAAVLMDHVGLTQAFFWIGIGMLLVSPLAWLVVRDTPESQGLSPDGYLPALGSQPAAPKEPAQGAFSGGGANSPGAPTDITPGQLFRNANFWKLGLAFALVLLGIAGTMFQLAPRLMDQGYSRRTALLLMSLTALFGTFGKYFWGWLCDRRDPRRVAAIMMGCITLGFGLCLLPNSHLTVILFVIIFGFSMGGTMSIFPIMTAYLFGRRAFARVFRFLVMFFVLEIFGYLALGQSHSRTGSYDTAYAMFMGLHIAAVLLVLSLKPPAADELEKQTGPG